MTWTKDKPTKPGVYLIFVCDDNDGLPVYCQRNVQQSVLQLVIKVDDEGDDDESGTPLEEVSYRGPWFGPIPEPPKETP